MEESSIIRPDKGVLNYSLDGAGKIQYCTSVHYTLLPVLHCDEAYPPTSSVYGTSPDG